MSDTPQPGAGARSLWAESLEEPSPAPEPVELRTGVVVLGAGLAGLLTATLLAADGADVLVVDRDRVGGQATRNTTAKLSCLQGTVLSAITRTRGSDAAAAYAEANRHALTGIRATVDRLGIGCDLRDAPAFTYATTPEGEERATAELTAARAAGFPATWVTTTELPFEVLGAVRLDGQAHVHPVLLCRGLADRLGHHRILERVAALDVEEHRDRCEVHLDGGGLIRADHVVLATQAPIIDPAALANRCRPEQAYALAARVAGHIPTGMYLSSDRVTRSVRPARGPHGALVVIGGEGHAVGEPSATPERWAALVDWAEEHWGAVEVTHRWATHDLVPSDHVPFVGQLAPTARRRWVATGFQKWGMTNAYVSAHLLRERIAGRSVPWQETFDATRIQASMTSELVSAGVRAARHMVGDRVVARLTRVDPEQLEPGSGAVTTGRGGPIAVSRTDDILRTVSARCTHQGCLVAFDAATQTWDCPCHGSRYDLDGRVIQGPATEDLAAAEL